MKNLIQAKSSSEIVEIQKRKIPHREILKVSHSCIAGIYRQKVLSQKTRTIRLLGRKSAAKIIHTLLGYEVQASYKRIQCPDLATARYLKLFSELGCHTIHLPYDPTLTSQLIPELENSIEGVHQKIQEFFPKNVKLQQYAIQKIYEIIRQQLKSC